jgi:hypothetical protein
MVAHIIWLNFTYGVGGGWGVKTAQSHYIHESVKHTPELVLQCSHYTIEDKHGNTISYPRITKIPEAVQWSSVMYINSLTTPIYQNYLLYIRNIQNEKQIKEYKQERALKALTCYTAVYDIHVTTADRK